MYAAVLMCVKYTLSVYTHIVFDINDIV
jgi:hypothetical protein